MADPLAESGEDAGGRLQWPAGQNPNRKDRAVGKIELVYDGNGLVLMFLNGQPAGRYSCEYGLDPELKRKLEELLCEFGPQLEQPDP